MNAPLNSRVAQFEQDVEIVHDIVHGPASGEGSMVPTDGGELKTLAKLLADAQDTVDESVGLREDLADPAGAALVGYGAEGSVGDAISARLPEIANYAALRAYSGPLVAFYVRGVVGILDGGAGVFRVDAADVTSADNGGTVLVDAFGRRWKREFSGAADVRWFGARGDGVTDDAEAIAAAVLSGTALYWGDHALQYRVASSIIVSIAHALVWKSEGASILFDPPLPQQYVVSISVSGGQHKISGRLAINANRKACVGVYVLNNTDTESDFVAEDLAVSDVYRASTAFSGGDGIWICGKWGNVHLERPDVRRVTMAAGAGLAGVQGVAGITVSASSTTPFRAPRKVTVSDPYVEKVASEDLAYTADQDGIRIFTAEDVVAIDVPYESSFALNGGTLKNCHGRSVKSQMENGSVRGTKFVRTEGVTGGVGASPEIDFQVGSGFVKDIECLYAGSVPSLVIGLSAPTQATKAVCSGSVDGVKVNASGGVTLPSVVQNGPRSVTRQIVRMRDIEVIGALEKFIRFNGGNSGNFTLLMRDCVGAPTLAAIQAGSGTWGGDIFADGIVNTGSAVQFLDLTTSTATPLMSVKNHVGFTTPKTMVGNVDSGPYERVTALTAYGATKGGLLRPVCFELGDGQQFQLPQNAVNVQSCMLLVSVGSSRNDQGIFACDSGAVIALAAGSGFSVGSASEPASGNFRIWSGGAAGGPFISNRSGGGRTFTVWMLG